MQLISHRKSQKRQGFKVSCYYLCIYYNNSHVRLCLQNYRIDQQKCLSTLLNYLNVNRVAQEKLNKTLVLTGISLPIVFVTDY